MSNRNFTTGNLTTNSNYHFKANLDHIIIYYKSTASGIGQINYDGVSAVWADDDYLYIATNMSGVAYIPITSISAGDYTNILYYKQYPDITSNLTNYIDGAGDFLCVTTISGVDHYNVVSGTRNYAGILNTYKCFQTSTGEFYYTLSGIDPELVAVYDSSTWLGASYDLQNFSSAVNEINDLFVVEGVSIYNNENLLLTATDNGIIVIEEKRGDEENCRRKRYLIM